MFSIPWSVYDIRTKASKAFNRRGRKETTKDTEKTLLPWLLSSLLQGQTNWRPPNPGANLDTAKSAHG
jgi:hypothetical protein